MVKTVAVSRGAAIENPVNAGFFVLFDYFMYRVALLTSSNIFG